MNLDDLDGARVLVAGAGVSGLAAAAALVELGAQVTVTDAVAERLDNLPVGAVPGRADDLVPSGTALVVTGPGRRPDHPLVAAAAAAGVPLVGEPELAWWLGERQATPPVWLAVTGTNGKTTTVGMLATILRAAGLDAVACGNIGYPLVDAVRAGHRVLAVELSSFQLHWSPSPRPAVGCVLNVAADHLDWHGSMAAYAGAKARVLHAPVAIAGIDDPAAAALLTAAHAAWKIGITLREPGPGEVGVAGGMLVDRAFPAGPGLRTTTVGAPRAPALDDAQAAPGGSGVPLVSVAEVHPGGPAGLTDALAAAALARAHGVAPAAVRDGLRAFRPGPHRSAPVDTIDGVRYVDDSKATNPHAAAASLAAQAPARVVWIVGGLLKGATVDDVVAGHASRLRAAVVIGVQRTEILGALARHAPEVPVAEAVAGDDAPVMHAAVERAAALARPGDVVLLAPAAASMDQFTDYAERGRAFAAAVAELARRRAGGSA